MKTSSNVWTISKTKRDVVIKTDQLKTPGPTKYNPVIEPKHNAPSWKFSSTTRDKKPPKNHKPVPGPGEYSLSSEIGNGIKYSIRPKIPNKFDITKLVISPGPANYEPNWKPRLKSASSYSIGLRFKSPDPNKNSNLGPGSYNLTGNLEKPSYKFERAPRDKPLNKSTKEFPAPNKYEIKSEFGKTSGIQFSKSLRDFKEKLHIPGPGSYETKNIIGNDGPKYSIPPNRPKTSKIELQEKHPAVGQYDIYSTRPSTPSYKIGLAKKDPNPINKFSLTVPGPQKYNPVDVRKISIPKWIFGKSLREAPKKVKKEVVPGPGYYENKDKLGDSGPKYSIRPKTALVIKNLSVPGPGMYNEMVSSVKEKTPSWRIGSEKRETLYKVNNLKIGPGPGRYEIKNGFTGPFIQFHAKLNIDKKKKFETPGPGFYKIPCSFRDVPRYSTGGSFDENFRWV